MAVTVRPDDITSQQTFDSYLAHSTALALRMVNESATAYAHGRPSAPPDGENPMLLKAARRLREAIDSCVDGDVAGAADILNDLLARHNATPHLHGHPGEALELWFHQTDATKTDAAIADMATSLAMIIGTGRTARLGRCAAAQCDRVFYDDSRNGSRRFCDLSCQNRAKASTYRARRARS